MVPPAASLISANSAPVGLSPTKVTFALAVAITLLLSVTRAFFICSVDPVIVIAPATVTVPSVVPPIPDNTVAATVPVSVRRTAPFSITAFVASVTIAAVTCSVVPEIVIPAAAAVTVPPV